MSQPKTLGRKCCAIVVLAALAASPAAAKGSVQAEDDDDTTAIAQPAPNWRFEAGAGSALRPIRRGENRYIFSPFPLARLSYGELFEASTRDGINAAVFSTEAFRFGPELELDRKERRSTRPLGPLSTTFGTGGAGVFGEWLASPETRARVDVTEGVFGREGLRVVLSGARSFTLAEPLSLDLGFRGVGGDRRYVRTAYGLPENKRLIMSSVVPAITQTTGARRTGSAGVTTLGPTLGLTYQASRKDVLGANLEASRVVGATAHTPAVRALGTRNALSVELAWRRTLFESN